MYNPTKKEKAEWLAWAKAQGIEYFFDAFMRNAQGAQSRCIHCKEDIYLDIVEGCGVPDWKTEDGDYGCDSSPESTEDGCGSHEPESL